MYLIKNSRITKSPLFDWASSYIIHIFHCFEGYITSQGFPGTSGQTFWYISLNEISVMLHFPRENAFNNRSEILRAT